MKKVRKSMSVLMTALMLLSFLNLSGQEFDDMYFNKKDRKKVSYEMDTETEAAGETYEAYEREDYNPDYTAKNVNPDFMARYSSTKLGESEELNYGVASEYYPEGDEDRDVTINNYYGSNFNSPWTRNGWNPINYYLLGSGAYFSFRFGNMHYGRYGGFIEPWFDPFFNDFWLGSMMYYDPFFNTWNSPFSWRRSMWWDTWGPMGVWNSGFAYGYGLGYGNMYYNSLWNAGLWNGYYAGGFYAPGPAYNDLAGRRAVVRGARSFRGGTVTGVSRSSSTGTGRRNIAQNTSNGRRDYSRSENEYYLRESNVSRSNNRAYSRTSSGRSEVASASRAYTSGTSRGSRYSGTRTYVDRSATRSSDTRQNVSRNSSGRSSNYNGRSHNSYGSTTRRYSSYGNSSRSTYSGTSGRRSTGSHSGSSYGSGSSRSSYSGSSRSSSGSSRSSYSGGSRSSSSGGGSRSSSGSRSSGGRRGG